MKCGAVISTILGAGAMITSVAASAQIAPKIDGTLPLGMETGLMASIYPLSIPKSQERAANFDKPESESSIGVAAIDTKFGYAEFRKMVAAGNANQYVGYRLDGFISKPPNGSVDLRVKIEAGKDLDGLYDCKVSGQGGAIETGQTTFLETVLNSSKTSETVTLDVGDDPLNPISVWVACRPLWAKSGVEAAIYGGSPWRGIKDVNYPEPSGINVALETRYADGQWSSAYLVREAVPERAAVAKPSGAEDSKGRVSLKGGAGGGSPSGAGWAVEIHEANSANRDYSDYYAFIHEADKHAQPLDMDMLDFRKVAEKNAPEAAIPLTISQSAKWTGVVAEATFSAAEDGEYVFGLVQRMDAAGKRPLDCVAQLLIDGAIIVESHGMRYDGSLDRVGRSYRIEGVAPSAKATYGSRHITPGKHQAKVHAVCKPTDSAAMTQTFEILVRKPSGALASSPNGMFVRAK